jgi:hypothetical protein
MLLYLCKCCRDKIPQATKVAWFWKCTSCGADYDYICADEVDDASVDEDTDLRKELLVF